MEADKTSGKDVPYMTLDIPLNCIHMVDNPTQFDDFLKDLPNHTLFGFDSEFCTSSNQKFQVSIIQIATRSKVYILDLIALLPVLERKKLSTFLDIFCFNSSNTILGFSLWGDFNALRNTHAIFNRMSWKSRRFLDMEPLFRIMGDFMVWPFESEKKGLSGLVQKILGRPLDKTLQVSKWEDRPLGASHVVYAALDAYVLLLSFERWTTLAEEQNELHLFLSVQTNLKSFENKLPKPFKKEIKQILFQGKLLELIHKTVLTEPVTPKEIRTVCDKNVGRGLMKKLRIHGVDCISPKKGESSESLSKKDNRIILTRGEDRAVQLKSHISKSKCLVLTSTSPSDQLKEIWTRLNVIDTEKFIFTRCIICNCDDFLHLKQEVAQCLYEMICSVKSLSLKPDDEKLCLAPKEILADLVQKSDRWTIGKRDQVKITSNGKLPNGNLIKIAKIPRAVITSHNEFFVCMVCGKVYYDGSHHSNYLESQKAQLNPKTEVAQTSECKTHQNGI